MQLRVSSELEYTWSQIARNVIVMHLKIYTNNLAASTNKAIMVQFS